MLRPLTRTLKRPSWGIRFSEIFSPAISLSRSTSAEFSLPDAYVLTNGAGAGRYPIRGGTDGSRLTEMGVPTPNVFTGMMEIHGPLEWISVQDMAKATEVCLNIARKAAG